MEGLGGKGVYIFKSSKVKQCQLLPKKSSGLALQPWKASLGIEQVPVQLNLLV
jgi:hypothetical protein